MFGDIASTRTLQLVNVADQSLVVSVRNSMTFVNVLNIYT